MAPKKTLQQNNSGLPGLDLAEVERLLAFMSKHGLEEFEFARGDFRIALKRAGGSAPASAAARKGAGRSAEPAETPVATETESSATGTQENEHIVKSPIVGTFFTAAGPEAKPFVKAGDRVKAGQVICIVEAMKLMNEIEADVSGVVLRTLVENAQPVEYGQPLFAIRPEGKK